METKAVEQLHAKNNAHARTLLQVRVQIVF